MHYDDLDAEDSGLSDRRLFLSMGKRFTLPTGADMEKVPPERKEQFQEDCSKIKENKGRFLGRKSLSEGFSKTKQCLSSQDQESFCSRPCAVDGDALDLTSCSQSIRVTLVAVLMNFPVSASKVLGASKEHPSADDTCFTGKVYRPLREFLGAFLFMSDILPRAHAAKGGSPKAKHRPAMKQQVWV
jgi:hypothetical protein